MLVSDCILYSIYSSVVPLHVLYSAQRMNGKEGSTEKRLLLISLDWQSALAFYVGSPKLKRRRMLMFAVR